MFLRVAAHMHTSNQILGTTFFMSDQRIELHELIKVAIHLKLLWETKTVEEISADILHKSKCKTLLEAIQKYEICRSGPTRMYLTNSRFKQMSLRLITKEVATMSEQPGTYSAKTQSLDVFRAFTAPVLKTDCHSLIEQISKRPRCVMLLAEAREHLARAAGYKAGRQYERKE
jgi:hypothetical protein